MISPFHDPPVVAIFARPGIGALDSGGKAVPSLYPRPPRFQTPEKQ